MLIHAERAADRVIAPVAVVELAVAVAQVHREGRRGVAVGEQEIFFELVAARLDIDAAAGVDGIEVFYEQCVANGVTIIKPITATEWGTKDFYVEDPDGYIINFGGRPAAG